MFGVKIFPRTNRLRVEKNLASVSGLRLLEGELTNVEIRKDAYFLAHSLELGSINSGLGVKFSWGPVK